MAAEEVIRVNLAVQYTGVNGAEIASLSNCEIVTDNGTTLEFGDPLSGYVTHSLQLGDWYDFSEGALWGAVSFALRHITKGDALKLGTMDAVSVAVPLLMPAVSVNRVVTWARPFEDDTYRLSYLPDANSLGRISVTVSPGTKTASGLTVTITNILPGAVLAGVLHVLGTT